MCMTASWSGSKRTYRIQILCSGRQNSGKSMSRITEPRERPMHQCHSSGADLKPGRLCQFVRLISAESFDLGCNRAGAPPGSSKMSKHTLVGGDGHKLLDLLAR